MNAHDDGNLEAWENFARESMTLIENQRAVLEEQRGLLATLERTSEGFLRELHNTLTITVELLEKGDTQLCLVSARIALAGLEKRIADGYVAAAESQIGWNTDHTGRAE